MLEIFQYDFMIRAFAAGILIGVVAPFIGTFMVVRHYSQMADTLAHVSLLGVALGLLLSINPLLTALVVSVTIGILLEKLRHTKGIGGDALLALTLSGSLALAVVLISLTKGLNTDLFAFLFGSITTVSSQDLTWIALLSLAILAIGTLTYKHLFFVSFDEEMATADGLPSGALNLLLITLSALTVSVSMSTVGILLISALMIIPVLTAFQFKLGFKKTIGLSMGFSVFSVIIGLFGSYYLNIASGGTIVLVALILFLGSIAFKTDKGT